MMDAEERDALSAGDVITECKNGQWVTEIVGDRQDSRSFTDRDEAVAHGREQAIVRGTRHVIVDSPPTGDITDPAGDDSERTS